MTGPLALAITVACLAGALTLAVQAGTGRFRWARAVPSLAVVEIALVIQAALDLLGLARGHHPREPTTHLAYLVASVLVLPVAGLETRCDDGSWSALLLAVALIVLAVLVIRLQVTGRTAAG